MSAATPQASANYCYRHPDRQSWILCQRCGRTICPECQTPAAVGVHCPECVAEARRTTPKPRRRVSVLLRPDSGRPIVTWTIMALTAFVYLLQVVAPGITQYLIYYPPFTPWEPWTMLTAVLAHSSFVHLAVNMLTLFLFGPMLEHLLGRWRFLALYVLAGFGGSVAVLWIAPQTGVLGASGAIFGLLGAFFVIQRGLGGNTAQLVLVIALNLGLGFFVPRISWQAHLGGLVVGALVAFIYMRTRERSKRGAQIALVAATAGVLVAGTVLRFALL